MFSLGQSDIRAIKLDWKSNRLTPQSSTSSSSDDYDSTWLNIMKRRHQKSSEITRTGSSPTCYGVGGEEDWSSQHFLSSHNLRVNSWFSSIVFFISVYFMTIAFIMILLTRIHDNFLQNSGISLAVLPSASLLDTSSRSLRTPTTSLNSEKMMR